MAARFFDTINYTESEYAEVGNRLEAEGIIIGIGSEGGIAFPGGMIVRLAPFEAFIQGFWYQNAANVDLTIAANTSGSTRNDTLVLRLDRVNNTITPVIVPNGPAPTRTAGGTWELLLWTIAVPNGAGAITAGMATDQRQGVNCGYTGGGVSSPNRTLASVSNVDVSSPFDRDTGLFWAGVNTVQLVAGATIALSTTPNTLQLGTLAPMAAVLIGAAAIPTTILGNLTISGSVLGTLSLSAPITMTLANASLGVVSIATLAGNSSVTLTSPDSNINYLSLTNSAATKQAIVALTTAAGQFLGGSGDLNIYTAGTGAGAVILGTANTRRLTADVTGKVHIGTVTTGVAKLNVMSVGQSATDGLIVYNANPAFYVNLSSDSVGSGILGQNGQANMIIHAAGRITVGAIAVTTGRLNVVGGSAISTEGLSLSVLGAGSVGKFWLDTPGNLNIQNTVTSVMLQTAQAGFTPISDFGTYLGLPTYRWAGFYALSITISGGATFAGALTGITTLSMGGTLTGVTSLTMNGALSGVTTLTMSGALSGATNLSASGNVTAGNWLIGTVFCVPATDNTGHCGTNGLIWSEMWTNAAFKNGGTAWSAISDERAKHPDLKPYTNGLDTVLKLNPIYYRYNGTYGMSDTGEQAGFSAQELQKVAPEMVGTRLTRRDPSDEEQEPDEILTMDVTNLNYMFVNAFKELHARMTVLERQLAERKN
jgi:hypothetical protein